jgi:hypothetical protein
MDHSKHKYLAIYLNDHLAGSTLALGATVGERLGAERRESVSA